MTLSKYVKTVSATKAGREINRTLFPSKLRKIHSLILTLFGTWGSQKSMAESKFQKCFNNYWIIRINLHEKSCGQILVNLHWILSLLITHFHPYQGNELQLRAWWPQCCVLAQINLLWFIIYELTFKLYIQGISHWNVLK